jgi:hypothetical protein
VIISAVVLLVIFIIVIPFRIDGEYKYSFVDSLNGRDNYLSINNGVLYYHSVSDDYNETVEVGKVEYVKMGIYLITTKNPKILPFKVSVGIFGLSILPDDAMRLGVVKTRFNTDFTRKIFYKLPLTSR